MQLDRQYLVVFFTIYFFTLIVAFAYEKCASSYMKMNLNKHVTSRAKCVALRYIDEYGRSLGYDDSTGSALMVILGRFINVRLTIKYSDLTLDENF